MVVGDGKGSWQSGPRKPRKPSTKYGQKVPAGKRLKGNQNYGYLETDPKQYPRTRGKDPDSRYSPARKKTVKPSTFKRPKPNPGGAANSRSKKKK